VKPLAGRFVRLGVVLWAGSLWSLALWVVPVTFRMLADRHQAGQVAAALFGIETILTLALAAVFALRFGKGKGRGIYLAAALLSINEWALRPLMQPALGAAYLGLSFGAWHGISGVLYIVACIAALSVIWQDDFG
jgi:Domain of unknown function (DUF4149)